MVNNNVEQELFKQTTPKIALSKNFVSMRDCPNNCTDGFIFNPYGKPKRVECSYCAEKRKEMLHGAVSSKDDKSLSELLQIPDGFISHQYDEENIFPEFALKHLTSESVLGVKKELKALIDDAAIGRLPDYSIMFNLGRKVNEYIFIYPYLVRLYLAGVSIAPVITPVELCQMRSEIEVYGGVTSTNRITYFDLLDRDMCIVNIDAGTMKNGFDAVKGLMQLRARRGKPTIIFTNAWGRNVDTMCVDDNSRMLNLATLYSVEYTAKAKEQEEQAQKVQTSPAQVNTAESRKQMGISSEYFNSLVGRS